MDGTSRAELRGGGSGAEPRLSRTCAEVWTADVGCVISWEPLTLFDTSNYCHRKCAPVDDPMTRWGK
ncbi:hypothetical protein FHS23_001344 [Prauserella isguenensis]|uniref:Uncharacterized protein n=1 Tax=Prauserella isguenensis TaxID=1470180 RepID=A0A839S0K8_9PSEU|nr:hypothetical protein [Prauserella isguenensis]